MVEVILNNVQEKVLKHGAKVQSKLTHSIRRFFRQNAGASVPFDWSKGIIGKPRYNIKNQDQSESCWGQMFSRMIQIYLNSEELSAKSAYSPIFVPPAGGVNLAQGEKEASVFGITTEKLVPSNLNGVVTESFMEDKTWMTPKMIDDCFTRRGWKVINVPINVDAIAQAIRDLNVDPEKNFPQII